MLIKKKIILINQFYNDCSLINQLINFIAKWYAKKYDF